MSFNNFNNNNEARQEDNKTITQIVNEQHKINKELTKLCKKLINKTNIIKKNYNTLIVTEGNKFQRITIFNGFNNLIQSVFTYFCLLLYKIHLLFIDKETKNFFVNREDIMRIVNTLSLPKPPYLHRLTRTFSSRKKADIIKHSVRSERMRSKVSRDSNRVSKKNIQNNTNNNSNTKKLNEILVEKIAKYPIFKAIHLF